MLNRLAFSLCCLVLLSLSFRAPLARAETILPPQFGEAIAYPVGNQPYGIASHDFDHDGRHDLLVTNIGSNDLSVLISTPSGFAVALSHPAGTSPYSVLTGDFNGDGYTDALVASFISGKLQWFAGSASGALAAPVAHVTGTYPFALASADLDGDGHLDVAVTCLLASTVAVHRGKGDGTFWPRQEYSVGLRPHAIEVADLDHDGVLDLLTANADGQSVSFLRGAGGGTFAAPEHAPSPGRPIAIRARDLGGDGTPEVFVAHQATRAVTRLTRTGPGAWSESLVATFEGEPTAMALANFGAPVEEGIVVVTRGPGLLWAASGFSGDTFAQAASYPIGGASASNVLLADLDGDQHADAAVTDGSGSRVFVLRGAQPTLLDSLVLEQDRAQTSYGDTLTLMCTAWPRNATGTITLFDGGLAIGSTPLVDGVATLRTVGLTAGRHALSARTASGETWFGVSDTVEHEVRRAASRTTLAALTGPGYHGDGALFEALVTRDTPGFGIPAGRVEFVADGEPFDTRSVAGAAVRSAPLATLPPGSHFVRARYLPDDTLQFEPSESDSVEYVVLPATPTHVTVSSSEPTSLRFNPVRFTAEVASDPAGAGVPAGEVGFEVDGVPLGEPVPLVDGRASSIVTTSLEIGPRIVVARFRSADSLRWMGAQSAPLLQQVLASGPVIAGVRDVPNDQGGKVHVTWRCAFDQPGQSVVTSYRIWRRVPAPEFALRAHATTPMRSLPLVRGDGSVVETFWEAIAALPAARLVSYGYTAATSQDSLPGSNPFTAFFVEALTTDPLLTYASPPDSGYSIDNLSPAMPAPFVLARGAAANELHWGANRAGDLREFRLYRGESALFALDEAHFVASGLDTSYSDAGAAAQSWYKLVAVDVHGNRSLVATVGPGALSAALAFAESQSADESAITLVWRSSGNEGVAARVYRQDGGHWRSLATILADASGALHYTDRDVQPGARYQYRLGLNDAGEEAFAGAVWATATSAHAPAAGLAGVSPHPAGPTRLVTRFSLGDQSAARLELLDVAGRRVVSRDVGALGAGEHSLNLAEGLRLAPGVYLVRLTTPRGSQTVRAVVTD